MTYLGRFAFFHYLNLNGLELLVKFKLSSSGMTPFSVAVGYQCFGGPCCIRIHLEDLNSNLHHHENLKSQVLVKCMLHLCRLTLKSQG